MMDATIEQIQSQLPEILQRLQNEGEVTIYSEGKAVGRLLPPIMPKGVPIPGRGVGMVIKWSEGDETPLMPKGVPIPGRGAGTVIQMIDDDEHLEDFKEYMP